MLSRSSLEEGGKEAEGGAWSSDAAAFAAVVAASLRLWRDEEAEAEAEWEGEGVWELRERLAALRCEE